MSFPTVFWRIFMWSFPSRVLANVCGIVAQPIRIFIPILGFPRSRMDVEVIGISRRVFAYQPDLLSVEHTVCGKSLHAKKTFKESL